MSNTSSEIFKETAKNITDTVGVQIQHLHDVLKGLNWHHDIMFTWLFTLSCSSQKYLKEQTVTRHLWSLNSSKKVILDHF